jgi:hypothetical protein
MMHPEDRAAALYVRDLPDGYHVVVYPMLFGKVRLCYCDAVCVLNGYCYESRARAIEAALVWNGIGDPLDGWHRHPYSGRRRDGGDLNKETVMR